MRMQESDPAKKVLCTKPGGRRDTRGRQKLGCCDGLEEDFARGECRNWRINAELREEWRTLGEEVKCHPGM